MHHVFEASCPEIRLRIQGHGLVRPAGEIPSIFVNGRPAHDALSDALSRDLSHARAVYRLVALCSGNALQLQIYVGEAGMDGQVAYQTASAEFLRGRLQHYGGLSPADAESFWFR